MCSKYIFLLIGQFRVAWEVSLTALAAFTAVDQKFPPKKGMNNKNEARRTSPFIRRARSRIREFARAPHDINLISPRRNSYLTSAWPVIWRVILPARSLPLFFFARTRSFPPIPLWQWLSWLMPCIWMLATEVEVVSHFPAHYLLMA